MKKSWVVGLLSIVLGPGLIALRQVVPSLGVMVVKSLLVFMFLTTTSTNLSAWFFSYALILWMLPLGYTVLAVIATTAPQESPERPPSMR